MTSQADQTSDKKRDLRRAMRAERAAVIEPQRRSRAAIERLVSLDQYRAADCVMWYVGVRDELQTRDALAAEIESKQKIVVPYCRGSRLELFHLESIDELRQGKYGILEPEPTLRSIVQKRVRHEELDLIVVPGVAFDVAGGRLGHGKGYYDRCLDQTRESALFAALAFDCQIVDQVPTEAHDVPMDVVVTETTVHRSGGL